MMGGWSRPLLTSALAVIRSRVIGNGHVWSLNILSAANGTVQKKRRAKEGMQCVHAPSDEFAAREELTVSAATPQTSNGSLAHANASSAFTPPSCAKVASTLSPVLQPRESWTRPSRWSRRTS
eukprot:5773823-Prymnesium_polylepis.1